MLNAKMVNALVHDLSRLRAMRIAGTLVPADYRDLGIRGLREHASELKRLGRVLSDTYTNVAKHIIGLEARISEEWQDHPLRSRIGLFGPLGVNRKELPLTTALAWLLNPKPQIGFRIRRTACAAVVNAIIPKGFSLNVSRMEEWRVEAESYHANVGRIDIVMSGPVLNNNLRKQEKIEFLIEAKINAPEGKDQFHRYKLHRDRQRHVHGCHLVALAPSDWRSRSVLDEEVIFLDYFQLLSILMPVAQANRDCDAYPLLRLFLAGVAQDICEVSIDRDNAGSGNAFHILDILKRLQLGFEP